MNVQRKDLQLLSTGEISLSRETALRLSQIKNHNTRKARRNISHAPAGFAVF